jgi:twitching motility protein PilT
MIAKNADELIMHEGKPASLRFGENVRPVSQKPLDRGQIGRLLAELSDSVDAAGVSSGRPTSFFYRLDGGNGFECRVGEESGLLSARVMPSTTTAAAVAETGSAPEPASEAAAPAATSPAPTAEGAPPIEGYLRKLVAMGASDLHLTASETPMIRLDGDMIRLEGATELSAEDVARLIDPILPDRNREEFSETNDSDLAYEIQGVARYRVNVYRDRHGPGLVARVIPSKILTAEQLGLPEAILDLCHLPKGLVLVTGPTGSGKSTTLAAMIDYINRSRAEHIITIEDPVEFVHPNQKCLVNQREVGNHTESFKRALRAALREDPDIILVGELRDLETIAIAIETAETGHLVFGTLHTTTAVSTVDRVIDQFPADRQSQIRTMLSESLRGVVAQNLLKKIGGGRVAALEVLIVTSAISNLIREGKTFQIASLMQTGKKLGMVLQNDALANLVKNKVVEPAEAYKKAADKAGLMTMFNAAGVKFTPESSKTS